ncbi:PASTA domain-containing protein [Paractinoplanes durhamensis]
MVGTVVAQDPKPDAKIAKGDNVTLTVIGEVTTDPSGDPSPGDTSTPGTGGNGAGEVVGQTLAVVRQDD